MDANWLERFLTVEGMAHPDHSAVMTTFYGWVAICSLLGAGAGHLSCRAARAILAARERCTT